MPPVTSSPRPKPRPSAPTMSIRPKANPFKDPMSPASIADRTTRPLKKGGEVIAEYGGKEKYSSKKAMKAHEKAEGPKKERAEKAASKKGKTY